MQNDPNETVPIEELALTPVLLIVDHWQAMDPNEECNTAIFVRQSEIAAFLSSSLPAEKVESFIVALTNGDPRARVALSKAVGMLGQACLFLRKACDDCVERRAWQELSHKAVFAARVASVCDRRVDVVMFGMQLAGARRALRDNLGSVNAYTRVIQSVSGLPNEKLVLAVAHGNLGLVLADLSHYDDALEHFRLALLYESDPKGIRVIQANRANCLANLGEFCAAGKILSTGIAQLENSGVAGIDLAIALDMNAQTLIGLGQLQPALEMLKRSRNLFPPDDGHNRAINAMAMANACVAAADDAGAAKAFELAHQLALNHARKSIDVEFYRNGFAQAVSVKTVVRATQQFIQGLHEKEHDNPSGAFACWQVAVNLARAENDVRLALRISANAGALLFSLGQIDRALDICRAVRQEASARGLALPELMALGTIAAAAASGVTIDDTIGALGPLARSIVLRNVHNQIVARFDLDPAERDSETLDMGQSANELAMLAKAYSAMTLATDYFRKAVEIAKSIKRHPALVNRLAGLTLVLTKLGDSAGADQAAAEIEGLLKSGTLSLRGKIVAHRALAGRLDPICPAQAIAHLRDATEAAERLRAQIPPGPNRADFDREFRDLPYTLAELLLREGLFPAAFEALQGAKGRRLLEAMASRSTNAGEHADALPSTDEVHHLLHGAGNRSVLVDFAVSLKGDAITAYVVADGAIQSVRVTGDAAALNKVERGNAADREERVVALCLHNQLLRELAEAVAAVIPAGQSLLLVPDQVLHNLPLHAIPVQGRPWILRNPISYLPSVALLRFQRAVPQLRRAIVAGDSRGDLRGAREECSLVGSVLKTAPFIGQACTRAMVEKCLREDRPDSVHLALHGRGDPYHGGRSSLLFADGKGGDEWVGFDALTQFDWTARLVVFSGCSTAVAGMRYSSQPLSVANAALEAGAESVIASMWPVDDTFAKIFMTTFYNGLEYAAQSGSVDLRLVLARAVEEAQKRAQQEPSTRRRNGRHAGLAGVKVDEKAADPDVEAALAWAPFCLIGAPMLRL